MTYMETLFLIRKLVKLSNLVYNFINRGIWDASKFNDHAIFNFIKNIRVSPNSNEMILFQRKAFPTFKSFIKDLYSSFSDVRWHKLIWFKSYALIFFYFAWICIMDGLKIVDRLATRKFFIPHQCQICFFELETMNHLFFECSFSFNLLKEILPWIECFLLKPTFQQLLEANKDSPTLSQLWKHRALLSSCCLLYFIWRERNRRRFRHLISSSTTLKAINL